MTYVLDTNIISEVLRNNQQIKKRVEKSILNGGKIFINAISYYEIKRGFLAKNATAQLKKFYLFWREYCEEDLILPNTQDIFDKATDIYVILKKKGKPTPEADIFIASIAICRNLILVSNDNHFSRIQELKIENWLKEKSDGDH